jgi:hypothetical protein
VPVCLDQLNETPHNLPWVLQRVLRWHSLNNPDATPQLEQPVTPVVVCCPASVRSAIKL